MQRLRFLWIGSAFVLMVAALFPGGGADAQDDAEATISALQTQVAALSTQVASLPSGETPAPSGEPEPGTVLYEANATIGLAEWSGPGWRELDGMLVTDGETAGRFAVPVDLRLVTDYALEAEIQVVKVMAWQGDGSWGYECPEVASHFGYFLLRDQEYETFICYNDYGGSNNTYARISELPLSTFDPGPYRTYDPGQEWRTYRLEVKGNQMRFLVDQQVVLEVTDNQFLSDTGGEVGFVCNYTQLALRSFRVIAL